MNAPQLRAICKRTVLYLCHAIGDHYTCEISAERLRDALDGNSAVGFGNGDLGFGASADACQNCILFSQIENVFESRAAVRFGTRSRVTVRAMDDAEITILIPIGILEDASPFLGSTRKLYRRKP